MFLEGFVFPLFCYQNQMCTTGSITSKNKGGGGQNPYAMLCYAMEDFHNLCAFFFDGFPKCQKIKIFHYIKQLPALPHILELSVLYYYLKKVYLKLNSSEC